MNNYENQVDYSHYDFSRYMNLARWTCYYTQIKKAIGLKPKSILEIGPGDGLFGWYIKKNNIDYKSADFADDIDTDYKFRLGFERVSVDDNAFDLVCAFQVLEHVPFEKVENALTELKRISRQHVFLDIPQAGYHLMLSFKFPLVRYFNWHFVVPRFLTKHQFDGQHYWEIGKKGYSAGKVRQLLQKHFVIKEEFSLFTNPKERFYILEKK